MSIIFVTGGARSGKSTFALEQAKATNEPVTFIATAQAFDEEMTERIARHQLERRSVENPNEWVTIEAPRRRVSSFKMRTTSNNGNSR